MRLAELLDLTTADCFDGGVDGLEVIDAPPGADVPGRFIGVYHSLVGGVFVSHVATSDGLRHWTPGRRRPARLAAVDRQRPGRLRARRRATRPTRSGSARRTSSSAAARRGPRSSPAR